MKVWELLDKPEKWTKGDFALDASGTPISIRSPSAVRWCLLGAVVKCYGVEFDGISQFGDSRVPEVVNKVESAVGKYIAPWNDLPERTYEEVFNLCKELDI